jgi:hypothetical protein
MSNEKQSLLALRGTDCRMAAMPYPAYGNEAAGTV